MVNAFHIDFAAIDVRGQSSLQNMLDFNILNGATLHSEKIIFLINPAPVNDLVKFSLENQIQPNTSAAPISFSEGVGDILISTYFSTISSKVDCGILSMFSRAAYKYIKGTKRKFPFEIFTVLISPAKS